MAFPSGVVVDNFNRANETPATNWLTVVDNNSQVNGNEFTTTNTDGTGDNIYAWNAASYGPDVDVAVLWGSHGGAGSFWGVELLVPSSIPGATRDGYAVSYNIDTNSIRLWIVTNSNYVQLGSTYNPASFTVGDSLGLRRVGSTVEAYYRVGAGAWTSIISSTDSTYIGSFKGGVLLHQGKDGNGIGLDNFLIGSHANLAMASGGYTLTGTASTLRSGSPTYLRHRK